MSNSELLLAIDTSVGTSVALVAPSAAHSDPVRSILAESFVADTMRHAEVIDQLIGEVLSTAAVRPSEVTGIVAGMGPGPFTGLRVGIAAARTFALACDLPLYPVVSSDASAYQHAHAGERGALLVLSDARRRELYWSLYELSDESLPNRIAGPGLAKPDALPYPDAQQIFTGQVSAGFLGLVALQMQQKGAPFASDQALYLRSPDVTLPSQPKRVSS